MKLYFYCSSGSLLEYFTMNKIVCNDYLSRKNRKIINSLGLSSSKFLFLTNKKLLSEKRMTGFDKDFMEIPAILEISVSEEDAKLFPVIVLDDKGETAKDFIMLSDLSKSYTGIFVLGEISFTYVSRIIFENDNVRDDIYRPSQDLYFPEHLYTVVDNTFDEDCNVDLIMAAGEELDKKYDGLDVGAIVSKRNKFTSIVLNMILETKAWPFGLRHKANFDDITAGLLGITDKLDDITGGQYSRLKDEEYKDWILERINDPEDTSSLAVFLRVMIGQLIPLTTTSFAKADFDNVRNAVYEEVSKIYNDNQLRMLLNKVDAIEKLVYGSTDTSLEKMLADMPEQLHVLKALTFFLRAPQSALKLADGLATYRAEPDVCRYAWIMFSALNGIEPIPAEKKGLSHVMRIAETKAIELCPVEHMIRKVSEDNNLSGSFDLMIEEQVTAALVRKLLLSEEYINRIPDIIKAFAANRVLSKGFKEKKYKIIKNPFLGELPQSDYLSQLEVEDFIAKLQSLTKKSKVQYDVEKFLADYIEDEKTFDVLYKKDEDFWRRLYKYRDK